MGTTIDIPAGVAAAPPREARAQLDLPPAEAQADDLPPAEAQADDLPPAEAQAHDLPLAVVDEVGFA